MDRSRSSLPATFVSLLLGLVWAASAPAAPELYANPVFESPVRAGADDLLLLSGAGLSASDTVIYAALADTRVVPPHPADVPAVSTSAGGVADVASASGVPYSLVARMPAVLDADQSYVLWVRSAAGEWSNAVRINDARPLWITPDSVYSQAPLAGLPRDLKVVGRNLEPARGLATRIRLAGPATYLLTARNAAADPLDVSPHLQRYVATAPLPAVLEPGTYTVELSRDGVSWVPLIGGSAPQRLTVRADPQPAAKFAVSDPLYGIGSDFRVGRTGTPCQPDDAQDDTPCILNAIYAARSTGGGTVTFGPGTWRLLSTGATGTFSGVPADGIVVPPNVNLEGAGADVTTVVRAASWTTAYASFTLQGPGVVRGIRFRDESIYPGSQSAGPMLAIGVKWYWATNYGTPAVTRASSVVITQNVFERPYFAIANGGLPIDHLFVTHNTFGGAYLSAIYLGPDANNTSYPYELADAVIAYNTFYPSSYADAAKAQGVIASQLASGRRVDFSNNTADGTRTDYLYDPAQDAKGWRAAYFWSTGANQEMVLVARNVALCTGDKVGDGEAIVFDSSAQNEALARAAPVLSAAAWADASGSPGTSLVLQGELRTTRLVHGAAQPIADIGAYYAGAWLRIVKGRGLGQWRRVVAIGADSGTVTVNVSPALDVLPDPASLVLIGRGDWQTVIVDNFVDQRQPMCTKGNVTKPSGGALSWYASTADSVMEGNQQLDTNGILLAHQYKEVDAAAGALEPFTMTQSCNEVRDNLVDGEYDWSLPQSASGIFLGYGATPHTGPPPVIGYGIAVAGNTVRQADSSGNSNALPAGAIGMGPSWWTGPVDSAGGTQWQMSAATLVFHNTLTDISGGGLSRLGLGIDSAFGNETVAWQSVLYANSCNSVQSPLLDNGIATVRICPSASGSCECSGAARDVGIEASAEAPSVQVGDALTYTARVTNRSETGSATGVAVFARPPPQIAGLALASTRGSCNLDTMLCELGPLDAGESAFVTLSGVATSAGDATATFAATHREPDPEVTNDAVSVAVAVTGSWAPAGAP